MASYVFRQSAVKFALALLLLVLGVGAVVCGIVLPDEISALILGVVLCVAAAVAFVLAVYEPLRALKPWKEKGLLDEVLADYRDAQVLAKAANVRGGKTYFFGEHAIYNYADIVSVHMDVKEVKHADRPSTYVFLLRGTPKGEKEQTLLAVSEQKNAVKIFPEVLRVIREHNPKARITPLGQGTPFAIFFSGKII